MILHSARISFSEVGLCMFEIYFCGESEGVHSSLRTSGYNMGMGEPWTWGQNVVFSVSLSDPQYSLHRPLSGSHYSTPQIHTLLKCLGLTRMSLNHKNAYCFPEWRRQVRIETPGFCVVEMSKVRVSSIAPATFLSGPTHHWNAALSGKFPMWEHAPPYYGIFIPTHTQILLPVG